MNIRKCFPWIPILGIPLTSYFHVKYGDTGIEDYGVVMFVSAILQGVWVGEVVYYLVFLY